MSGTYSAGLDLELASFMRRRTAINPCCMARNDVLLDAFVEEMRINHTPVTVSKKDITMALKRLGFVMKRSGKGSCTVGIVLIDPSVQDAPSAYADPRSVHVAIDTPTHGTSARASERLVAEPRDETSLDKV